MCLSPGKYIMNHIAHWDHLGSLIYQLVGDMLMGTKLPQKPEADLNR